MRKFKKGDIIICIDNYDDALWLTKGKRYKVEDIGILENEILIKNDRFYIFEYPIIIFKKVIPYKRIIKNIVKKA